VLEPLAVLANFLGRPDSLAPLSGPVRSPTARERPVVLAVVLAVGLRMPLAADWGGLVDWVAVELGVLAVSED